MRRLAAATLLCWLALCAPAFAAGVNVFIGSSTIPALRVDQTVNALAADAAGDMPGPVVSNGAFPSAADTGVPAGTSLTAYSGANPVTTNGTVIDSKTITGTLDVRATGVIVKNSMITGNIDTTQGAGTGEVTVQDSTIDCNRSVSSAAGTAFNGSNFTVLRANIYDCENGSFGGNTSVTDSFINDLYQCSTAAACDSGVSTEPHTDGFQIDPAVNTTIRHNTIQGWTDPCRDGKSIAAGTFSLTNGSCNGTSAVMMCANAGCASPHDVLITNNLISGGAYSINCPTLTTTNVQITNNHFSTAAGSTVGAFGISADCSSNETWSGNTIHENGHSVTADQNPPY